jgi:hypothetical protein
MINDKYYLKYTNKYLDMKHAYKFIHPDEPEIMVVKLLNDIVKLSCGCFPPNTDDSAKLKLFNEKMEQIYLWYKDVDWFFVFTYDDILIGYCYVFQQEVITYKKKLKTYTKLKINNNLINNNKKNISPYIAALCKDKNYSKVGSFLLDNVCDYLHKIYNYDIVYLCPGSDYFKYNYEAYVMGNECSLIDDDKYYDSNMKLINYYKINEFVISPNLYLIIKCKKHNEYIFYNVMYKKLK